MLIIFLSKAKTVFMAKRSSDILLRCQVDKSGASKTEKVSENSIKHVFFSSIIYFDFIIENDTMKEI